MATENGGKRHYSRFAGQRRLGNGSGVTGYPTGGSVSGKRGGIVFIHAEDMSDQPLLHQKDQHVRRDITLVLAEFAVQFADFPEQLFMLFFMRLVKGVSASLHVPLLQYELAMGMLDQPINGASDFFFAVPGEYRCVQIVHDAEQALV